MSKYGPAHGKAKVTCGCFDSSKRRLITGGSDGSIKIWNFSNGDFLSTLIVASTKKKPEAEITGIECVYDPLDLEKRPEDQKPD